MAGMIRRTRRHPEAPTAGTQDSTPKPIKDMTEDERRAFFADMRARTAAKLREMTQAAAGPGTPAAEAEGPGRVDAPATTHDRANHPTRP